MKKIVSFISLILCSSLFFITGCKNFFDGKDFISSLEKTIEYNQAPYAAITINSPATYTDFISPAAGNWNSTYKCGDIIQLEFTPTANYQFTKWTATPEGSILFGENNQNQHLPKVNAQIENADETIIIEPKVYERPTITVSPGNSVENPRNSSIVISFSHNMNISEDDLSSIQVFVDDLDAITLNYYKAPECNEENTKIIFKANRENLIPVDSVAKTVKVVIPKAFNYLQDNCEISLKDVFSYSFMINSTTETKIDANFECELTQGEISYTGNKTLYLDNEFSVRANPKEGFLLSDWSIVYSDDKTPVEESILNIEKSADITELKIKVLTGSNRKISISPVFVEREFVMVSFSADVGTVSPAEEKKYYVGETINISYRESGNFIFTKWESSNEEAVSIKNKNSIETTCEIKCASTPVTIKANCAERPYVTGISPAVLTMVNKDTPVKILFSQSMSESSIYWTLSELKEEGITEQGYDLLPANTKTDKDGNQYYYAYQKSGNPETLAYKNISITERGGDNLLKHYLMPYFETEENVTLIIPSKGGANSVPRHITIDVSVSPKFKSTAGVFVNQSYLQTFNTNSEIDATPPKLRITEWEISGIGNVYHKAEFEYDDYFNINKETYKKSSSIVTNVKYFANTEEYFTEEDNMSKFYANIPYFTYNPNTTDPTPVNISVKIKGDVSDDVSKPAFLSVSIVPIDDDRFTTQTKLSVEVPITPNALGYYDFNSDSEEKVFTFPISELINKNEFDGGIYKILIQAKDNANNVKTFEKMFFTIYCPSNIISYLKMGTSNLSDLLSITSTQQYFNYSEEINFRTTKSEEEVFPGKFISANKNYYYLDSLSVLKFDYLEPEGLSEDILLTVIHEEVDQTLLRPDYDNKKWLKTYSLQNLHYKICSNDPIKKFIVFAKDKYGFTFGSSFEFYVVYSDSVLLETDYRAKNPDAIYANSKMDVKSIKGTGNGLSFTFPTQNHKIKTVKTYVCNYKENTSRSDYEVLEDPLVITAVQIGPPSKRLIVKTDYNQDSTGTIITFNDPIDLSSSTNADIDLYFRGLEETKVYARIKFIDEDGIEYDYQEFFK